MAPVFELVIELSDQMGKAAVIEACTCVFAIEKMVNSIEEPAHGETGEEVHGRLLFILEGGVRVELTGQRDR